MHLTFEHVLWKRWRQSTSKSKIVKTFYKKIDVATTGFFYFYTKLVLTKLKPMAAMKLVILGICFKKKSVAFKNC